MGRKKLEIKSGEKYGKLTIIEEVEPHITSGGYKMRRVRCLCDCGCTTVVNLNNLLRGNTTSCGCYKRQKTSEIKSKTKTKTKSKAKSKTNEYDLSGEIGIGYTSRGERFLFDKEDFDIIKDYYWSINDRGYVMTYDRTTGKNVRFHRLIMHPKKDEVVDHINHDKTNNCKSNLRICSPGNNAKNMSIKKNNTSGFTGVKLSNGAKKWQANIDVGGKRKHLGCFTDINEAIRARIKGEIEIFGEYSANYFKFTREQRKSILDDTMSSEEIVEILKLNQYIEQCV